MDRMKTDAATIAEFPTFLSDDHAIDIKSTVRNIDRLLKEGIKSILFLGAAGEYTGMSSTHQLMLLNVLKEYNDKARIIIAVQEASTAKAIIRIKQFQTICDFEFAIPTHFYFNVSNSTEVFDHYEQIIKSTGESVYSYDFPDLTHNLFINQCKETLLNKAGIKGILVSDTCIKSSPYFRQSKIAKPDISVRLSSRSAFLFPQIQEDRVSEVQSMLEISSHPAAVIKFVSKELGYCESDALFSPFSPLSNEQKESVRYRLKQLI